MKEFVITASLYLTIPAESEAHALAKFHEFLDSIPFPAEVDWMEVEDEYEISD